ncbi:MAG: hypothetical protein ABIQ95_15970 [Bdellovibrionia bacterium]
MRLGKSLEFLIILVFLQVGTAAPSVARDDLVPGSRYTSARAAGMGGAFLSVGEDVASGLFNNPANLAKIRRIEFELANFSVNVNSPFASTINFSSLSAPFFGPSLPVLSPATPSFVGGGWSGMVDFGMPGFACGILMQRQFGGQLNADGTVSYRSLNQLIPAIGTGFKLFEGLIRVGYSMHWVIQALGTFTRADPSTLSYTQELAQGSAFSHNLGVGFTLPVKLLPTFDLVVRNAVGTRYGAPVIYSFSSSSTTVPALEAMTFDGSFSIQPHLGKGSFLNIIAEYRDILSQSQVALLGRISLGAELAVRGRYFFRGGWGAGYPSAGLAIRTRKSELSLAWYATEIGTGYLSQGDTRFMLQYQIRSF